MSRLSRGYWGKKGIHKEEFREGGVKESEGLRLGECRGGAFDPSKGVAGEIKGEVGF